jgi:hypothetical protein
VGTKDPTVSLDVENGLYLTVSRCRFEKSAGIGIVVVDYVTDFVIFISSALKSIPHRR